MVSNLEGKISELRLVLPLKNADAGSQLCARVSRVPGFKDTDGVAVLELLCFWIPSLDEGLCERKSNESKFKCSVLWFPFIMLLVFGEATPDVHIMKLAC